MPSGVVAPIQCSGNDGQNYAGNISREIALCVVSRPLKLSLFTFKDEKAACGTS